MSLLDPRTERRIKRLEDDLSELNKLFIKNDQELRKKIKDLRITQTAGVCATEFTLANRLGITIDVVLSLLPNDVKPAVVEVIDKRLAEMPDTVEIAKRLAEKQYKDEGDDY